MSRRSLEIDTRLCPITGQDREVLEDGSVDCPLSKNYEQKEIGYTAQIMSLLHKSQRRIDAMIPGYWAGDD